MSVAQESVLLHYPLMGCMQDQGYMGYTMAIGCCAKVEMPLFPTHVILELAIVRGVALDAAKEG
jgi:hypothetical protein